MRVALVQKKAVLGDKDANIEAIRTVLEESGGEETHDLYVFPELFLTGYMIRDDIFRQAEFADGEYVQRIAALAQEFGTAIVCGMAERTSEGQFYNTAVFTDGERLETYRKMHLVDFGPFEEFTYFLKGDSPVIIELDGWLFGLEICYDVFFPELTKLYALMGCDFVVNISASPSVTGKFFETVFPARAVETTMYILYTNLVGAEKNLVFWGGAQAYSPRGKLMAKGEYFKDQVVSVELDRNEITVSRPLRPTLRDTRADLLKMAQDACGLDS